MANLDPILTALTTAGKTFRRLGTGYMAQCPAHKDNKPSLAITPKDDKVMLHCFAGCDPEIILDTLALTWADLFDQPLETTVIDMSKYLLDQTSNYAIRDAQTINSETPPTPIQYIYRDIDGNIIGKKVRLIDADGKKTFRQYRYTDGQWLPGLQGIDLPLYNSDLIAIARTSGQPIWLVEGEKDADTLSALGEFAVTMPNGAGAWAQRYTDQLNGCTIHIIADNDEPGLKHAAAVKDALDNANIDNQLYLPAAGKDITDHINNGATLNELINAQEQIDTIRAEQWQKQLDKAKNEERLRQTARDQIRKEILDQEARQRYTLPTYSQTLTDELNKHDDPIIWLIQGLWPENANVTLTATYKAGKTSTINTVLKCLADTQPLFDDHRFTIGQAGRIANFNYEVNANQARVWLREKNIINTNHITLVNMRGYPWPYIHDNIRDRTIQWLIDNNITTWIIDPLARAFVGSGDENSNQDMGLFLDTLDYIKEQSGVKNMLIAAHTGRNAEQGNNRARGASRFDDWADVRWMLTKDDNEERFFAADGRDVNIEIGHLQWDADNRQQTFDPERKPTTKRQAKTIETVQDMKDKMLTWLRQRPRSTSFAKYEIGMAVGLTRKQAGELAERSDAQKAINQLIEAGAIITEGKGNATKYFVGNV